MTVFVLSAFTFNEQYIVGIFDNIDKAFTERAAKEIESGESGPCYSISEWDVE